MKIGLKKKKINIYKEKKKFIFIIKGVVKGRRIKKPPLFSFLLSVVSIDKTRFRKPSASIVDKSSLP